MRTSKDRVGKERNSKTCGAQPWRANVDALGVAVSNLEDATAKAVVLMELLAEKVADLSNQVDESPDAGLHRWGCGALSLQTGQDLTERWRDVLRQFSNLCRTLDEKGSPTTPNPLLPS